MENVETESKGTEREVIEKEATANLFAKGEKIAKEDAAVRKDQAFIS